MAPKSPRCPDAGDIIKIQFDPQAGREMRGYHPALVLSPREYNAKAKLCVLCPITSRGSGDPFEVALPFGLETGGVVIADQVKSLSWYDRDTRIVEQAPGDVIGDVLAIVAELLQIGEAADEEEAA